MRFPFSSNKVTGHFGTLSEYRRKNGLQPHSGTDWAMPEGTAIPAIAKGTIKLVQWSEVLGWVVVQTAMDKDGEIWYLGYCHLAKKPEYEVGHKVAEGDIIAKIGGGKKFPSGSASTGGHLHATASKTLKGVFGTTAQKVDLYKLIQENQSE
jgi:hypothetical protein